MWWWLLAACVPQAPPDGFSVLVTDPEAEVVWRAAPGEAPEVFIDADTVAGLHAGRFDPGPLVGWTGGWLLGVGSSGDLIAFDDQGRAIASRWRNRASPPRLEEPAALWVDESGWWALGNDSANVLWGHDQGVEVQVERVHYAHALVRDGEGRLVVGRAPRFAGDAILEAYTPGEAEPEVILDHSTLDEVSAMAIRGDQVRVAVWTTGEVVDVDLSTGEVGEVRGVFDRPRSVAWAPDGRTVVLDAGGVWVLGEGEVERIVDGEGFGFGRTVVVE